MIYAELSGGLGNQMFVYAFARAMGLCCQEPVTLIDRQDWKTGSPAHTALALQALHISSEVQFITDAGFAKQHLPVQNAAKALMIRHEQRVGLMDRDWHPFEARMAPMLNAIGLHFATEGFTPAKRGHAKNFLAWGYFQGADYFKDQAETIRAELLPIENPEHGFTAAVAAFAREIEASPFPVCLHWRCGDYLLPQNAALQVCTPEYYAAACRMVCQSLPQAELFVFSDDPAYVRQHLDAAGLPVHYTYGTNKFSAACGTTFATAQFFQKGAMNIRVGLLAAVGSFVGSALGSHIVLLLSDQVLRTMMLIILPVAAVLILWRRDLPDENRDDGTLNAKKAVLALAIGLGIGLYDGIFGPGTGTFAIIAFTTLMGFDLRTAGGNAKVLNLASNYASLVTYLSSGLVVFSIGIPCAISGIVGNLLGSHFALKKGAKFIRPMMLVVLVLLLGKIVSDAVL
jgi:uncharacterized membrane protein YfcA